MTRGCRTSSRTSPTRKASRPRSLPSTTRPARRHRAFCRRARGRAMAAAQLPHLETFARAAELGSFTAAGKALGLTQAAVSQRIQALEQVLDLPLFERQGGHVRLTEAGHRLY